MTRELTPEENAKVQDQSRPELVRKGERRNAGADTPSGPRTDRTTERAKKHLDELPEDEKYPKAPAAGTNVEKH